MCSYIQVHAFNRISASIGGLMNILAYQIAVVLQFVSTYSQGPRQYQSVNYSFQGFIGSASHSKIYNFFIVSAQGIGNPNQSILSLDIGSHFVHLIFFAESDGRFGNSFGDIQNTV